MILYKREVHNDLGLCASLRFNTLFFLYLCLNEQRLLRGVYPERIRGARNDISDISIHHPLLGYLPGPIRQDAEEYGQIQHREPLAHLMRSLPDG